LYRGEEFYMSGGLLKELVETNIKIRRRALTEQ